MPFLESPRFDFGLRFGLVGGPEFSTEVITVESGYEQRAQIWAASRGRWQADIAPFDATVRDQLIAFFRAAKGRANGFRYHDRADGTDAGLGALGLGAGTGLPAYQLFKRYSAGGLRDDKPIRKPVPGTVAVQRNGSPVAVGSGAGQIALDTTTGIVTFQPDSAASVASVTPGAATVVTLSSAVGLSAGELLYLSGLSGTAAATLNGQAWPIASVSGAAYTLSVATTGLTASGGTGAKYPQPTDTLTYTGQHDWPVRFDTDQLQLLNLEGGLYAVQGLVLIEIRT